LRLLSLRTILRLQQKFETKKERVSFMEQRVEGVYPTVEEALQTVDRLRDQGYSRDNITLVANEEVRSNLSSDVDTEVTTRDEGMNRSDSNDDDGSFWDSIKDAFTTDDSYDVSNYDDPNYDSENDPVYEHRDAIRGGSIAVLVRDDASPDGSVDQPAATPGMDGPATPGMTDAGAPSGDPAAPGTPTPDPRVRGSEDPAAPDPNEQEIPDTTDQEMPDRPDRTDPDNTRDTTTDDADKDSDQLDREISNDRFDDDDDRNNR